MDKLPVGKELKRKDYYLKNPSRYIVSLEEFEQLKQENDDDVKGFSYEEYCEIEREGWNDMAKALFQKDFEALNIIPKLKPWRNTVKRVTENNLINHLPVVFDERVVAING